MLSHNHPVSKNGNFQINKMIYEHSQYMINKCTLSIKHLFVKPASGSENNHEFSEGIGIGTHIGIGIGSLMQYRDSYRNR